MTAINFSINDKVTVFLPARVSNGAIHIASVTSLQTVVKKLTDRAVQLSVGGRDVWFPKKALVAGNRYEGQPDDLKLCNLANWFKLNEYQEYVFSRNAETLVVEIGNGSAQEYILKHE